jgi:hypothetical protein
MRQLTLDANIAAAWAHGGVCALRIFESGEVHQEKLRDPLSRRL